MSRLSPPHRFIARREYGLALSYLLQKSLLNYVSENSHVIRQQLSRRFTKIVTFVTWQT